MSLPESATRLWRGLFPSISLARRFDDLSRALVAGVTVHYLNNEPVALAEHEHNQLSSQMEQLQDAASSATDSDNVIVLTPHSDSLDTSWQENAIPWSLLQRGLYGVASATKAEKAELESIVKEIMSDHVTTTTQAGAPEPSAVHDISFSLREWHGRIGSLELRDSSRHRAYIALGFAFLCQASRENRTIADGDLDFIWNLIHKALNCPIIDYTVSRSAQGFLAVPLWSIVAGGNIEELFRFHVWLPDGSRGVSDFGIHAHQPFAQSWILAGKGKNHTFTIEPAEEASATHSEFGVSWADSKSTGGDSNYKVHQTSSTVVNLGKPVRVIAQSCESHGPYSSYVVPAGVFHRSEIAGDAIHSTLFLFDSSRGFQKDAPVLGPIDRDSYTQQRDPGNITAKSLANMVNVLRVCE